MGIVEYVHLPEEKVLGQRVGQAIVNAARKKQGVKNEDIHSWLFYIDNKDLEKLLISYYKDLECS